MTIPSERTRALVQTGAWLKELRADKSAPERIRHEARWLLRHYPTLGDLSLLAAIEKKFMGSNLLTTEFDPDWTGDFKCGPYTW